MNNLAEQIPVADPEPMTILMVDDDPANLTALDAVLAPLGCRMVKASSGAQALRTLLAEDFAVILLDVQMPGMDGFETAALIRARERSRHTPIIFLTASDRAQERVFRGYAVGGVDYIFKPYDPDILRSKVSVFADLVRVTRLARRQAEELAAAEKSERELAESRALLLEELQHKNVELERASGAKSQFLSRMSHELRTPLNAILGFGQLLELDPLSTEQRESVEQILRAGRHLLGLIDEVLDLSRIEAGRLRLSVEPVAVGATVREVVGLVGPLARARGIELQVEGLDEDQHVLADRQRLQQVLLNLLANAVKYNRARGWVRVTREERGGGRVRLSVVDSGPGISPDQLVLLFSPFERLGAELGATEGTGLGLALSKHLAEAMGGSLTVASEVGVGSTFSVELALATAPADALSGSWAPAGRAAEASPADVLVLCIEDNPSNLRLIEQVLARRPGARLISAMQGRLGLKLAQSQRPDLILLDRHLPDLPGDEVLRLLQEDPQTRDIPVVIVSADASPGEVERVLAAGARAYLTKPLEVPKLLALLDEPRR